jgi:hypothetical protein
MRAIKKLWIYDRNNIKEKVFIYVLWVALQEFSLSTPWWIRKHSIHSSCYLAPALEPTFTTKNQLGELKSSYGVN